MPDPQRKQPPVPGWRGRLARAMRPPRRLIPTRAGLVALGTPLILGVAAINAGNNLLFLILGACLGMIVLSGLLSERNISWVDAEVRPVGPAYAGEEARLTVQLTRAAGHLRPAFGLRVRERKLRGAPKNGPQRLDVMFPIVEGKSASSVTTRRFDHRGKLELDPCELSTTYPFGLFTKVRDLDLDCAVLVRPRRVEVPEALADALGRSVEGQATPRRGLGPDLYGLREWDPREPPRRIHALRSARLGREVVVETEAATRPVAWLAIANVAGASDEAFERTLELAQATIVEWDLAGYAVALRTARTVLPPGVESIDAMLDHLAILELEDAMSPAELPGALWLVPEGVAWPRDVGPSAIVSRTGTVEWLEQEVAA